eukprot:5318757-Pleurochrysis_carterae.AAC.2
MSVASRGAGFADGRRCNTAVRLDSSAVYASSEAPQRSSGRSEVQRDAQYVPRKWLRRLRGCSPLRHATRQAPRSKRRASGSASWPSALAGRCRKRPTQKQLPDRRRGMILSLSHTARI